MSKNGNDYAKVPYSPTFPAPPPSPLDFPDIYNPSNKCSQCHKGFVEYKTDGNRKCLACSWTGGPHPTAHIC